MEHDHLVIKREEPDNAGRTAEAFSNVPAFPSAPALKTSRPSSPSSFPAKRPTDRGSEVINDVKPIITTSDPATQLERFRRLAAEVEVQIFANKYNLDVTAARALCAKRAAGAIKDEDWPDTQQEHQEAMAGRDAAMTAEPADRPPAGWQKPRSKIKDGGAFPHAAQDIVLGGGSNGGPRAFERSRSESPPLTRSKLMLAAEGGELFEVDWAAYLLHCNPFAQEDTILHIRGANTHQLCDYSAETVQTYIKITSGEPFTLASSQLIKDLAAILALYGGALIQRNFLLKCHEMLWSGTTGQRLVWAIMSAAGVLEDENLLRAAMRMNKGASPDQWSEKHRAAMGLRAMAAIVRAWEGASSWAEAADALEW